MQKHAKIVSKTEIRLLLKKRKASVTYHKKDPLSVSYLCTSRLIIFKYECASCQFMAKGLEKLLLVQNVFIACELTFSSVQLQSHIH